MNVVVPPPVVPPPPPPAPEAPPVPVAAPAAPKVDVDDDRPESVAPKPTISEIWQRASTIASAQAARVPRLVWAILLVLLASMLGGIAGALFDQRLAGARAHHGPRHIPRAPGRPHAPGGHLPTPTPSPQPGGGEGLPPYIMPAGEKPPLPAKCHFTQPSNAKDPTAMEPGEDKDGMRSVQFVNRCDGDLMVNVQGFTFWDTGRWRMQSLPQGGGFPLAKGESRTERISERMFSGRIWARPNCKRPCNIVSCGNPHNERVKCAFRNGSKTPECIRDGLWCDSGNCPGGNETTCRGTVGEFIGGLPPGPLMELTLCGGRGSRSFCYKDGPAYDAQACDALSNVDYYDISNVDGVSKIWAGMEVSRGRRLTGQWAPAAKFNCGSPRMPGQFDMASCPQPLRIARNDSNPHGYSPNASVAQAIGCLSACNFMSQAAWAAPGQPETIWVADRTAANRAMGNPTQPDLSLVTTEDVSRTCCECGHLGDRGSCPQPNVAPDNTVTWPGANMACFAGCSPYGNYPAEYGQSMCKLEHMPAIQQGSGSSIPLGQVQAIFKKWAPEAYSWQFDDFSSTYTCEAADFKLTFCPRGGRPQP